MVLFGDTEEELRKNARPVRQIAFYASTRTYQAALAVHGLEDLVPRQPARDDPRRPAVLAGLRGA